MARLGFEDLKTAVVDQDLCTACGACEATCPLDLLHVNEKSRISDMDACVDCGICLENCHRFRFDEAKAVSRLTGDDTDAGKVIETYHAHATDDQIQEVCQDGGVVSALLKSLLESGDVDAAITVFEDDDRPWMAEARTITTFDEVLESAGSKYTVDGTLKRIPDATDLGRTAIVTLPCQAQSLALSRAGRIKKGMERKLGPVITIFCMEAFDYDLLANFIDERFGLTLDQVAKMDIANGKFIVTDTEGEKHSVPVKECDDIVRPSCTVCHDLTGEYSDISVGNIGSPGGSSTIITRTPLGEKIYHDAVERGELEGDLLENAKPGFFLVEKLTRYKTKKNS